MNIEVAITVGVSILTSGVTAFAVVAFKMGRYSEKIDQLEKCDLNTRLSKIEGQQLTKRKSPITLTDRGETVLKDSAGKQFVDENLEELHALVEERAPKTSYDVQEASKTVIESLESDDRMSQIKEYLFREGMDFEGAIEVLGIYLRDKILAAKGWNKSDIDKYDPGNNE